MKINKSNSITGAVVLLLFGLFLTIFLLGLSLFGKNAMLDAGFLGRTRLNPAFLNKGWQNAILFLLLPLPPILCMERGIYELRRGISIRKDEIGVPKSIWRTFAVYFKYADFLNNLFFALFFLALIVLWLGVLMRSDLTITINTLMFFVGSAAYIALRKTLAKGLKATSNKWRKGFPSYTLLENGIEMRLFPVGKSKFAVNPPLVRLYFDELDEIRVFNDVEAENYMQYAIGPDLSLSKIMVEDKYRFLKGEIPRPSVFRSGSCTNSKSVLFRGRNLFYLITFETDDVEIIEESFRQYAAAKQTILSF